MINSWNKLDNAALIFPAASKGADTQVFRISCELHDQVEPGILQRALDDTTGVFRFYQSVLKRGAFWYYLDHTDRMPVVHKENTQPCENLYKHSRSLLFDVSYFGNRVNLEVYHVLSDGTGALQFLKTLIIKYLSYRHHIPASQLFDASIIHMNDDSFRKYYTGSLDFRRKRLRSACRLHGPRYPEYRLKVITGVMGIQPLLDAAHKHHATLTVYLCACLMNAISESVSVRQKEKPVILAVPVDLRQHFPSDSVRNFFSILLTGYDYAKRSGAFEDVIKKINADFHAGLAKENLSKWIDVNSATQHNVAARVTPLVFKDLTLKAAYNYTMLKDTAGFSNLGVISMPPEIAPYIRSFDVFSGTNKLQVCMCSFEGRLSVSFSSPFVSSEIPRRFFRALANLCADVEISSNHAGDEEAEV